MVITSSWLRSKGIDKRLADSYVKSNWLERVARGVFKRSGDHVDWPGVVRALQKDGIKLHPGGKTSLELQGYGHYIKLGGSERLVFWKTPETRVPGWFKEVLAENVFRITSVRLFHEELNSLKQVTVDNISIQTSVPERAILEYLYDVPHKEGFDEAWHLMEGLTSLRPSLLQPLLVDCRSVKVKRLFMYLAEIHNHPWMKRLETSNIDFGSGKRSVVKGGKLNKKYGITVPANMD